jgi:hypothetical protein
VQRGERPAEVIAWSPAAPRAAVPLRVQGRPREATGGHGSHGWSPLARAERDHSWCARVRVCAGSHGHGRGASPLLASCRGGRAPRGAWRARGASRASHRMQLG